ncbi:MAG: hypothetical protein R3F53_05240 [Gammaproteobacteria bacterium]
MMSTAITILQGEHTRFQRLLTLLEHQLANLQQTKTHDFSVLQDGLRTLDGYRECIHQPLEQQLLERVMRRIGRSRSLLRPLITEDQLAFSSRYNAFRDSLDEVLAGGIVPKATLMQRGSVAIAGLRRQILIEEGALFPLATTVLQRRDWQALERQLAGLKQRSANAQRCSGMAHTGGLIERPPARLG